MGPWFIIPTEGLEKPWIEPANPGLQGVAKPLCYGGFLVLHLRSCLQNYDIDFKWGVKSKSTNNLKSKMACFQV